MKLFRYGDAGAERPGVIDAQGVSRDASAWINDWTAATVNPTSLAQLQAQDTSAWPIVSPNERLGPCVGLIRNVLCIGLNYADHAAEAGMALPSQAIVFSKHTSAITGPYDDVYCPPGASKLDWEVELGVVIGQTAWHVSPEQALTHVAGYCLVNDVSERHAQLACEGQWIKGKSYPSHCPVGPWLVTPDDAGDVQQLNLWLDVNGQARQRGNTRTMVFGVAQLISYLSRFMALQPGDLIATGTPPGVGMGHKPPVFLQVGDVMTLGGQGLGTQRQRVVAAPI